MAFRKIVLTSILPLLFYSCKNYSPYAIDERPIVKIDTNLLGMWKRVGDTLSTTYLLVQTLEDNMLDWKNYSPDSTEWATSKYYYRISYMYLGKWKEYEKFPAHVSTVNGSSFLNLYYSDWLDFNRKIDTTPHADKKYIYGYLLLRQISLNKAKDSLAIAMVADTTLHLLTSSAAVRKRVTQHLDDPTFYQDTMRFYKVSNKHHLTTWESIPIANPGMALEKHVDGK